MRDLIYAAIDSPNVKISGDVLRGSIKICDEILLIPNKIKDRDEFKKRNARRLAEIEEQ